MTIYKEKQIKLETDYDWREGWVSTSAYVKGKIIAEYVADEGPRIYIDEKWDEEKFHDDEDKDDFIGVKTKKGTVSLSDWMREHEETSSVERQYCNDVAAAYADWVLDGKKNLYWKSYRDFANAGWYWIDDDEPGGSVDTEDPDIILDLENADEKKDAKEYLVRWYSEEVHKRRNPAEFHEQNLISLPDDEEFLLHTF
jgi:hypothetical protein